MEHIREGKHGARSTKQAIAIGLSKARRAGVKLKPPSKGRASQRTRTQAQRDYAKGQKPRRATSRTRSRATSGALRREGKSAASRQALSRHAHASAQRRGAADRRRAAQQAARTKGPAGRRSAARKAARTGAAIPAAEITHPSTLKRRNATHLLYRSLR